MAGYSEWGRAGVVAGHYTTPSEDIAIVLAVIMLSIIGLCFFCYICDIYRLLPGWGPIRKFDCEGDEDMRLRQYLIHEHARNLHNQGVLKGMDGLDHASYGADGEMGEPVKRYKVGPCTWGVCEAPMQEVPVQYPGVGAVNVREGFQDTQRMREESSWWARDEPHFIAKTGFRQPQLLVNDAHLVCAQRMA